MVSFTTIFGTLSFPTDRYFVYTLLITTPGLRKSGIFSCIKKGRGLLLIFPDMVIAQTC